jgi:hypothetical protein
MSDASTFDIYSTATAAVPPDGRRTSQQEAASSFDLGM